MADKLADEYYYPDQPTVDNADLTQYLVGSFLDVHFPITVPFRKWAHQQLTITRSHRHYTTNHPLTLRDIEIDWTCMKSVAKQHCCLWQRKQSMKIIWELYAYQNLKLLRGHVSPRNQTAYSADLTLKLSSTYCTNVITRLLNKPKKYVYRDSCLYIRSTT